MSHNGDLPGSLDLLGDAVGKDAAAGDDNDDDDKHGDGGDEDEDIHDDGEDCSDDDNANFVFTALVWKTTARTSS